MTEEATVELLLGHWHAEGRLHDGDMLRINSHASWRVRQILSRWRAQMGLAPGAVAESLDEIDSEREFHLGRCR